MKNKAIVVICYFYFITQAKENIKLTNQYSAKGFLLDPRAKQHSIYNTNERLYRADPAICVFTESRIRNIADACNEAHWRTQND